MRCIHCHGELEVLRTCRRVRMRCTSCGTEFPLHEVASQLDPETELILGKYNTIIYD